MVNILKNSPIFGLVITVVFFILSLTVYRRYKMNLLHPIIVTEVLLISLLLYLNIDYQDYLNSGANIISFLLGPATIVLAIPLFRQWNLLKTNVIPIIIGVTVGSITGILSMFILSKLFGLSEMMNLSLLSKSVTTPIAIDISNLIGGIPSFTVFWVIMAGILGAIFGPMILKLSGVKNEIAQGIAIGTASHGLGTARALEEGEVQGAMSGLSVGLTGLVTALIIPFAVQLLRGWM